MVRSKEERTNENKTVWFHGFEMLVEGQISDMPGLKRSIINIKQELITRKLYSFEQYTTCAFFYVMASK